MDSMQALEQQKMTLPITQTMLHTASQFAEAHQLPSKQAQVYGNTLAIWAVHNYLELMDFSVNLAASDSWNPLLRLYSNVADLFVVGIGHLECRPLSTQQTCTLPLDLPGNRTGLILVDLDEEHRRATLWGFTSTVTPGTEITLSQLQPLEHLLQYLETLETRSHYIQLAQWFTGQFEQGWQSVEVLLGVQRWNMALGFMGHQLASHGSQIAGAKVLDLGVALGAQTVVLLVVVVPQPNNILDIRVQLHPVKTERYLPEDVKLTLITDSGTILNEVTSRTADNFIQLPRFRCQPTEVFSLQLSFADVCVTEQFDCGMLTHTRLADDANG